MRYDPEVFLNLGVALMNSNPNLVAGTIKRRWATNFATSPLVCSIVWDMLKPEEWGENRVELKYLLWTMHFMKTYKKESDICGQVRCDEKTLRKWVWLFMERIAELAEDVVRICV
jgi:hypothetical protein